jgi:hypothetical protein
MQYWKRPYIALLTIDSTSLIFIVYSNDQQYLASLYPRVESYACYGVMHNVLAAIKISVCVSMWFFNTFRDSTSKDGL